MVKIEHVEGDAVDDRELERMVGRVLLDATEDFVWGHAGSESVYEIKEVMAIADVV